MFTMSTNENFMVDNKSYPPFVLSIADKMFCLLYYTGIVDNYYRYYSILLTIIPALSIFKPT